jgi:hypothetical protein
MEPERNDDKYGKYSNADEDEQIGGNIEVCVCCQIDDGRNDDA